MKEGILYLFIPNLEKHDWNVFIIEFSLDLFYSWNFPWGENIQLFRFRTTKNRFYI